MSIRPIVFCGPSGSGKSTLIKRLMAEFKDAFGFSVSHTTRQPRAGEVNGKDYHFTTKDQFKKEIAKGAFLEHAEFSGNIYGTSKNAVKDVLQTGRVCILDVDVQGVKNIKRSDLNPVYIFITPPSISALEQRLRDRKTETEDSLKLRLSNAQRELDYGQVAGNFDHVIVNDDLETAYTSLRSSINKVYPNLGNA